MSTERHRRKSPFTPFPRPWQATGWALVPLRAFLGATFCFAGLQKLASKDFFDASRPSSIQAQILAAERTSPVHALLGHAYHFAVPIGVAMALGELAVGLGALLGLWTRLAAAGGMALSLALFLTVSYHSHPYYTGSDIVFFFAWTPLVMAGGGGVLSLDRMIDARLGKGTQHETDSTARAVPSPGSLDRRRLIVGGGVTAVVATVGLALGGAVAAIGRLVGPESSGSNGEVSLPRASRRTPTPAPGSQGGAAPGPPQGHVVGPSRAVPVGGAASFRDPASGDPALVLQPKAGDFRAFDAVCPHAGCTVAYSRGVGAIVCPCHGSQFNATTGAVEVGPATTGLAPIKVAEGPDGQLYADG